MVRSDCDGSRRGVRILSTLPFFAAALVTIPLLVACEPERLPPSDPDLRAELAIPDDTPIHRVDLGGASSETSVIPRFLEVHPGDLVQFVVLDNRVHLVRFPEKGLGPTNLAFLRETSQDRPPPLVERGARLVLSFGGAPLGVYTFIVEGYGAPMRGEIRVVVP
ncbi:MAG: hypothetical protein EXR92_07985 [Gemmatimonadetes bacterium]|nr:hypothetical protein [Gemmatimonadota bacterium]